MLRKKRKFYL